MFDASQTLQTDLSLPPKELDNFDETLQDRGTTLVLNSFKHKDFNLRFLKMKP